MPPSVPPTDAQIHEARLDPARYLHRHHHGVWRDFDVKDWKLRNVALSSYQVAPNLNLWIITEWDRSVTTLLLPSEY